MDVGLCLIMDTVSMIGRPVLLWCCLGRLRIRRLLRQCLCAVSVGTLTKRIGLKFISQAAFPTH